jgi:hypothetical protein
MVDLEGLRQWPSHFHPRALLVAARLAGGDGEQRLGLLREASAAFEGLGNPRGIARCRRAIARVEMGDSVRTLAPKVGTGTIAYAMETWTAPTRWTLTLGRTGDRLMLGNLPFETPGPRLSQRIGTVFGNSRADVAALTAAMQEGSEVAPPALVSGLASEPGRFVEDVAAGLLAPIGRWPATKGQSLDLAIDGERQSAAALPWELLRLDQESWQSRHLDLLYRLPGPQAGERYAVRWLQAGLRATLAPDLVVDGIIGPRTRKAMDAALAEHGGDTQRVRARLREALAAAQAGGRRPTAVIIAANQGVQSRSRRGITYSNSRLPDIYQKEGFDLQLVQELDLDGWLRQSGTKLPPTIIHIYATWMEERTTGYLGPDLGQRFIRGGPLGKNSSGRGGPGWPQIPLLILDGPGEPDPAEQVRQILIRNAGASVYARRADCPNVLALGLDTSPDLGALQGLLSAVRRGEPLRDIYRGLAGDPPGFPWPDLGGALASLTGQLAPALWTANPDLSILPPRGP